MLRLAGALLLSVAAIAHAQDTAVTLTEAQYQNLGVTLGKPEAVQQAPLLNAPAQVVLPPGQEHVVSAAQAGLVTRLDAAVGDSVKQGQALATLDSPELLALQQQYLQAAGEGQLAAANYQRDKKLHDAGVIPARRWQETASLYQTQSAALHEARQLLAIAGMSEAAVRRLTSSKQMDSRLLVAAPADGVVLERHAQVGERVGAQAPLYRIGNLQELWLELSVPQQRAAEIHPGDLVQLLDGAASAHVTLLGQSVDPQTQTVLVRAKVVSGALRVGQTLDAQVVRQATGSLFKLPNTALAMDAGQAYVFSRNASGFSVKPVAIVGKQGDYSYLSPAPGTTLHADESVALSGAVALKATWLGLGAGEE